MIQDILITFLISISPFGEGKVGIPWGIDKAGLAKEIALLVGLTANLLVFPFFYRSNSKGSAASNPTPAI